MVREISHPGSALEKSFSFDGSEVAMSFVNGVLDKVGACENKARFLGDFHGVFKTKSRHSFTRVS